VTKDGVAKLSDFGCSSQLDGAQTKSMNASLRKVRGTIPFMAPEGTQLLCAFLWRVFVCVCLQVWLSVCWWILT